MNIKQVHKITYLLLLGMVIVVLSGCDGLFGPEEEETTSDTNRPTETAIGFYDGFISGSSDDIVGLVPLTPGVEYRIGLSGLSADVSFVVREGTTGNIGTVVVGSTQNDGRSSASIRFTATQSNYVAGVQLLSGSGTSYSLTTYEIR
ncbi:MAG: hypothetical protein WD492_01130 [Alkalispirochaeta sp.]